MHRGKEYQADADIALLVAVQSYSRPGLFSGLILFDPPVARVVEEMLNLKQRQIVVPG